MTKKMTTGTIRSICVIDTEQPSRDVIRGHRIMLLSLLIFVRSRIKFHMSRHDDLTMHQEYLYFSVELRNRKE